MKKKSLSNEYLSAFCMEIAMLLHSGMPVAEGLAVLMEDDADPDSREMLAAMSAAMSEGRPLSHAMKQAGRFPEYALRMAETGERAGRLEDTFTALSEYYDNRRRLDTQIRNSLLYPCILMLLMLVVIVVILVKVMPIFDQVFAQLGVQMTGLAGGLLKAGQALSSVMPALLVILALAAAFIVALCVSRGLGSRIITGWRKNHGEGSIAGRIDAARFASALSIGMASGLPIAEALELAASFSQDVPAAAEKHRLCRESIDKGAGLAEALRSSGIFSAKYCQMISVGVKSGSGPAAMAEAARRMEEEAEERIDRRVRSIEPAMIIIVSVIIGLIILAVMLPLINIMSAIG